MRKKISATGRWYRENAIWIFPLLAFLGVGVDIAVVIVWNPRNWDQNVQIGVLIALTIITAVYAYHTQGIQRETKKQAEASTKMAQATHAQAVATAASVSEMVKQRYLSTQPWVFPALFLEQETSGLGGALYEEAPPSLVSFRNLGNGVAIGVTVSISQETGLPTKARILEIQEAWKQRTLGLTLHNSHRWPIVDRGQRVLWVNAFESPREDAPPGIILVEYQDIYGTEFLSGWAYRFARVQGERLALIPGEPLYPVSRS